MDFNDTPEEAAFRAEVRDWLAANAPGHLANVQGAAEDPSFIALARDWQRLKAEAGFASIRLPKAVGGRDAPPILDVIFAEEEARHSLPVGPFVTIGTHLTVPTILAHGTPEQCERFVRPTLHGDLLWCQLFSEPSAGSDLAGLRTRAVRDGDDWVISGQKVWNSWAHVSDWGILVARTDPTLPKHRGLTFFLVDMTAPGIDVRPIRQISGESEFNEVFFSDVRIPDSQRLGKIGDGWKVAMTTLMNERISVGESGSLPDVHRLIDVARNARADSRSGDYRMRIAEMIAQEQGLKYFRFRLLTALSRGQQPGAIAALSKLAYANLLQDLSALAIDVQGPSGLYADAADSDAALFQHGYCWSAALRIAGGTDEILRNQIAERVLGLPGDVRVDKDVPFNAIPTGR